nr:MAG TPA: hypothetical protein [Caudoviricetes sp.]
MDNRLSIRVVQNFVLETTYYDLLKLCVNRIVNNVKQKGG